MIDRHPDQSAAEPAAEAYDAADDGHRAVARIEAFSDGVVAIIITIMVLELHPPLADGMDRLWTLWPVFLAYLLSYAYIAIYWVNHHRLFGLATRVTNALVWSNILLLFTLSLVPFATAYLGDHRFSRPATLLYLVAMLLPALSYTWLEATISITGRQDAAAVGYHGGMRRKGVAATILYLLGMPLTWFTPWAGIACAALVAILWFLPESRIDAAFWRGGLRVDKAARVRHRRAR